MPLNAAQKAALRRRKDLHKPQIPASDIQQQEVRDAVVAKLTQTLTVETDSTSQAPSIAADIEDQLYQHHGRDTAEYRSAFRRLLVSLKNNNTNFAQKLLDKEISAREFASKKSDELKSKAQITKDKQLKEKALKDSVGKELLPENIRQIHDGRDREKWGVSRSAAAIDD